MENEIVLDQKAVDTISAKVVELVTPALSAEVVKQLTEKQAVIEKKIKESEEQDQDFVATKELRFMNACIALTKGETAKVVEFNKKALELRAKAGYNNAGTDADGGYILALPEFEAELEKLAPDYGVSLTEANVRRTGAREIRTNKRGSNVTMYRVAEGGTKVTSKIGIERFTLLLEEFAGIAIATDILVEDSAIDFWQDVVEGFAEEMARWADTLVFTDNYDSTHEGILRMSGTKAITVGANITSLTWDNLMDAEVQVPTKAFKNGKWYMHRTVWNIVRKAKDSQGRYQWFPQMGLQTPWGTPVVLVDVMPASTVVGDANEPYAVFGDLKRIRLYIRRGLQFLQSQEATLTDVLGASRNLFTEDMTALRATFRMGMLCKFPEAFCIVGTGTVS